MTNTVHSLDMYMLYNFHQEDEQPQSKAHFKRCTAECAEISISEEIYTSEEVQKNVKLH